MINYHNETSAQVAEKLFDMLKNVDMNFNADRISDPDYAARIVLCESDYEPTMIEADTIWDLWKSAKIKSEKTRNDGELAVTHLDCFINWFYDTHYIKQSKNIKPKPPIGLTPRHIVAEARIIEINAAMARYHRAGMTIPKAWILEADELKASIPTWQYIWMKDMQDRRDQPQS